MAQLKHCGWCDKHFYGEHLCPGRPIMSNESLNEQLDNYAITQDAAREARQASNELKALESLIRDVDRKSVV